MAYFVICLLKLDNPRWWVAVGGAIGADTMTQYDGFPGFGCGGRFTFDAESAMAEESPLLWCGVVIAILIMLPNIVWQIHRQFVSLECMKTIHARDRARGSTNYFLINLFLYIIGTPTCVPSDRVNVAGVVSLVRVQGLKLVN